MNARIGQSKRVEAGEIARRLCAGLPQHAKRLWNRAIAWAPPWGAAPDSDLSALSGPEALPRLRRALRRPFVAILVFSVVTNLLALTLPVYMSLVYDRVLTSYSIETLLMLSALALGLLRLFVALDGIRSKIVNRAALYSEQNLAPALLAASVRDQLSGQSNAAVPLRDLAALRSFASSPAVNGLFDAPLVPLYAGVTFLIHPILGLLTLLGAGGMFFLAIANQAATVKHLTRAARASNTLLYTADSQIRNADAIMAMGLLPALVERWRKSQDVALSDQLAANDRGATFRVPRATCVWLCRSSYSARGPRSSLKANLRRE